MKSFLKKSGLQLLFGIPVFLVVQELASIYLAQGVVFAIKLLAYIITIIIVGELYEIRKSRKSQKLNK